ncbi:PREDICTED: uncharacterized protein LOC109159892 [Ipomoea nil]|uniref:uncharacterized protein LOC109159892 n=1 Tax=Ipomoea nil TaxID=35883 RepID=UPI000900B15D|nr:PREDICTED: uncharacterized protein LOC109159892 [Ipomoea nil]
MGDVVGVINDVMTQSKKWNQEVFGNIFKRKNLLQSRIQGIQSSPWYNNARGLQNLEQKLMKELSSTLAQEELLWFQKSRRAWIEDGDKNTNYYHKSTVIRRSRGRVRALKINGEWTSDPIILKDHITEFFSSLFRRNNQMGQTTSESHHGYSLNTNEAANLIRLADVEEVRKAVFGMKRMGSPALMESRQSSTKIFGTWSDAPESAADFRPITLLNVIFKIISKVVVNRLRPLMDKLVGPHQNSFLPGRSTLDNIVLTQEIMHGMRKKKGKKGSLVMKIDLHKAYDSIDWSFLKHTLQDFGFPTQLISLILFSLKESSIGILWNGGKLPAFTPERGLRQGDPLAPYLFILAMEKLSMKIQLEINERRWKPIVMNRGGTAVSHLFFADDLMLFGDATESQIKVKASGGFHGKYPHHRESGEILGDPHPT